MTSNISGVLPAAIKAGCVLRDVEISSATLDSETIAGESSENSGQNQANARSNYAGYERPTGGMPHRLYNDRKSARSSDQNPDTLSSVHRC